MEAGKLSCIGSLHHAFRPPSRGISRDGGGLHCMKAAGKTHCLVQCALSCRRPLPQLNLLPIAAVLSNLASGVSAWAVEEASGVSAWAVEEALSSTEAASAQVSESAGAAAVGGPVVAASQAVQSSMEGAGAAASLAVESVDDAASKAIQSSVERAGEAASQTVPAAGNDDMVINILGTAAFIALSLLTVAVVYLFLTDFLEKRKRDEEMKKLNEEEAAARKKKGGSLMAGSRGGAKGFGQKRVEDGDD